MNRENPCLLGAMFHNGYLIYVIGAPNCQSHVTRNNTLGFLNSKPTENYGNLGLAGGVQIDVL